MKLSTRISKLIDPYPNKPEVSFFSTNPHETKVLLRGGDYDARQAVEEYFDLAGKLAGVENQPNAKTITLKIVF